MRIAITGGTGFVGRNVARHILDRGHEVVVLGRSDALGGDLAGRAGVTFVGGDVSDLAAIARAFAGCDAVAHCAGINREIGTQTYARVHIEGTRNVVEAAKRAGVRKIAFLSFLGARPHCGSPYHESKFAGEEIVRGSSLDFTILKSGVIYGRGDHMLDHLSHAFHTFPVFALVGFRDKPIRPTAVQDVAAVIVASLLDDRLSRQTVAVTGPDLLTLGQAVRRVAEVCNRKPLFVPMPVAFHYGLAWLVERCMKVPLISLAQVRILAEGLADAAPACESLPRDLAPVTHFTPESIRRGLPAPGPFALSDCRCCHLKTERSFT
jgi:uncharacterized protein YbjT (DUF2867 family)